MAKYAVTRTVAKTEVEILTRNEGEMTLTPTTIILIGEFSDKNKAKKAAEKKIGKTVYEVLSVNVTEELYGTSYEKFLTVADPITKD